MDSLTKLNYQYKCYSASGEQGAADVLDIYLLKKITYFPQETFLL